MARTPKQMRRRTAADPGVAPEPSAAPPFANVAAVTALEDKAARQHSRIERVSATISRITGSLQFFLAHVSWFALWLAINLGLTPIEPFDPYPFSFLTMTVSLEAIFLSNFVLMAQNVQVREGDRRTRLNFQIDLLAEQESTATLRMVYALCRKAKVEVPMEDARLRHLLDDTNVATVAKQLEETLEEGQGK